VVRRVPQVWAREARLSKELQSKYITSTHMFNICKISLGRNVGYSLLPIGTEFEARSQLGSFGRKI
jgi:hypothetical protein